MSALPPSGAGRLGRRPHHAARRRLGRGVLSSTDRGLPARTRRVRVGGGLAAAVLGLLATLVGAPAEAAVSASTDASSVGTTTDPAKAAAGYLARQLIGGNHYESRFGSQVFPNYGGTADGVFGMAAGKASGTALAAATDWLAANVAGYADPAGAAGGPYPSGLAKLAIVAEVTGRDPHAFGGVDLLGQLRALECPPPGAADCPAGLFKGSFNVIVQAFAVLALSRSTAPADRPDAAAIDFLVGQQCADGGFPSLFPADTGGTCVSDVDGAAYAAQALIAAGRDPGKALDWLESARQQDGSFLGGGPPPVPNSNSTGVAVQALAAGGRDTTTSVAWLRARQLGCAAPPAQRGAITYAGTYTPQAVLATAQALPGLVGAPLTELTVATDAEAGAPVLACLSPGPSPSPAVTSPASGAGPVPPAGNAAPPPGLPATNGVSGVAVRWLAGAGTGLVALGALALVLVRRRA